MILKRFNSTFYFTANLMPTTFTKKIITFLTLSLLLAGCSILSVHKINIDQGNIVTQDIINDLKIGMTKRQVIYVLGTPLIVDPFSPDRWSYYYAVELNNRTKRYEQKVTLIFEDNTLVTIEGDLQPENPDPEPVVEEPKAPKPTIKLTPNS